jgi:hypothetical protein
VIAYPFPFLLLFLRLHLPDQHASSQPGPSAAIVQGWMTAIGTVTLAVFAIVAAYYARKAFREQTKEVEDQAEMLKVQSERLEVYRKQAEEQHEINASHGEVLELQAREIRASLDQRERAADEERRRQAAKVSAWFAKDPAGIWGARIRNASDLPVVDVRVFFYYIAEQSPGGDWEPVLRGAPAERIRVVPPQGDRFFAIPEQVLGMMDQVGDDVYAVGIRFTDAAGNHWERDPRGALTPSS